MRTQRLQPQTLIQQVLNDAKKALDKVSQDGALSRAQVGELPVVLQGVADTFVGVQETVQADAIVAAIQTGLETTLRGSLAQGQMLREELTPGLVGLLSLSSLGVQVEKMLANQEPLSIADAQVQADSALRRATPGVQSQLEIYKTLAALKDAIKRDDPTDQRSAATENLLRDRATLMRHSVNTQVALADKSFQEVGTGQAKQNLHSTLQAAHDVYSTVAPTSSRLRQLAKQADGLGVRLSNDAAQVQPFFARFLENQNRGAAAPVARMEARTDGTIAADADGAPAVTTEKYPSDAEDGGPGVGDPGDVMVTMKAPSDNEDGGADGPGAVTEKYPSDAEDGGPGIGDDPGDIMVTMKAPSDAEDAGPGIGDDPGDVMVTMKAPSDGEDGGPGIGDDPGDIMVTMKAPSDAEDAGPGIGDDPGDIMVTMKAPSDNEDGGADGPGMVTEKFPSDAEDGGAGDPGDVMVTLKYPSDNEDGGGGPGIGDGGGAVTEKYPSDAEDGGGGGIDDPGDIAVTRKFPSDNDEDGDIGAVTEKYPSDAEDGGAGGVDDPGMNVTLKYPSDNEDGGGADPGPIMVTMKAPSDNEDGGTDDPGGIGDITTAKFPSDNEDGGDGAGGDGGTIDDGVVTTAKYPSDAEDGGADTGAIGNITTAKFPSDAEDGGNE